VDRTIKAPSRLGRYVTTTVAGEPVKAFVPPPLPTVGLDLSGIQLQLERANRALGRLDGLAVLLLNVRFLLYLYVRKEALVSSQIEGTQSSFADVLLFENKSQLRSPRRTLRRFQTMLQLCNMVCVVFRRAFRCLYGSSGKFMRYC
jgi:hypothetical protein